MIVCPVCSSSHGVCSVEDVIYNGTSTTNTRGVNIGMFGTDEFSQMYFTSTTVSGLAQLLSPPRKPLSIHWLFLFILGAMGYYTLKPLLDSFGEQMSSGLLAIIWTLILGFMTCFVPGVIAGVLCYLIVLAIYTPARMQWKKDCNTLLSSNYCPRDGIIFDSEGTVYSPNDYVSRVFSH